MTSFYVTLPSSVEDPQTRNTSSQYVTRLPQVLNLERDKWSVALSDIIYPYSYVNVGQPLSFWVHFKEAPPVHVTFPSAQYSKIDEIINVLNGDLVFRRKRSAAQAGMSTMEKVIKVRKEKQEEEKKLGQVGKDAVTVAEKNLKKHADVREEAEKEEAEKQKAAQARIDAVIKLRQEAQLEKRIEKNETIQNQAEQDAMAESIAEVEAQKRIDAAMRAKQGSQALVPVPVPVPQGPETITGSQPLQGPKKGPEAPTEPQPLQGPQAPVSVPVPTGPEAPTEPQPLQGPKKGPQAPASAPAQASAPVSGPVPVPQGPETITGSQKGPQAPAPAPASVPVHLGPETPTGSQKGPKDPKEGPKTPIIVQVTLPKQEKDAPGGATTGAPIIPKDDLIEEEKKAQSRIDAAKKAREEAEKAAQARIDAAKKVREQAQLEKRIEKTESIQNQAEEEARNQVLDVVSISEMTDAEKTALGGATTGTPVIPKDGLTEDEKAAQSRIDAAKKVREEAENAAQSRIDAAKKLREEANDDLVNTFSNIREANKQDSENWLNYNNIKMHVFNRSEKDSEYQESKDSLAKFRNASFIESQKNARGFVHFNKVDERKVGIDFTDDVLFVEFDKPCAYFLGFTDNIVRRSGKAQKNVDFYGNVSALYLYCDCVEPNFIGNELAPLLSIIPCSGKYGDMIRHTITHPRYYPIMSSTIDSIKIRLLSEFAEPIDFNWGTTIVVLHFKKNY